MMVSLKAPVSVVFGCGTLERVGGITEGLGAKNALVVTGGSSMKKYGYLENVVGQLENENISVSVFDGITPDPKAGEVDEGVGVAAENNCRLVVGLGGGSAIDAAKAIAVSVGTTKNIREFIDGARVDEGALPIVAIPSTAGTGSETSAAAIIKHDDTGIKGGVRGDSLFPKIAVVDPNLTLTVPKNVAFDTGFDTLAHAIESYISVLATPATDYLAVESMTLVYANLPKVIDDGSDILARTRLSLAATLMGVNIANAGSCTPHKMQYPLAAACNASHGRALSALIPAWAGYQNDHAKQKFDRIAEIFGGGSAADAITEFSSGLGFGSRLSDFGVKKESLPELASQVSIKNEAEPRKLGVEDVERIYGKAM